MAYLGPLLWLTDLSEPLPDQVGLSSEILSCNRLEHRITVQSKAVNSWSDLRSKVANDVLRDLEAHAEPNHWFVARRPLTQSEFST